MSGSSFGRILRLTSFGESHGSGVGGVLDGCPAGIEISEEEIQAELDLRKPGQGGTATRRKESDKARLLSGVFEGKTTGTPIAFYVVNEDQHSRDYADLAEVFRPGHADWTYYKKFCGIRDYRGGGRASARETIARVAAGTVAKKILQRYGTSVHAACVELGGVPAPSQLPTDFLQASMRPYFAPSEEAVVLWNLRVEKAREAGDTLGGIVAVVAQNVPVGLGEPVFDKLEAMLAHAVMSVGAVKGVEIGEGFAAARLTGAQNNDSLLPGGKFASNHAGGILGGISSGQDILLRAAVKPIASLSRKQKTVDQFDRPKEITVGGRHDLSAIPRIVPVLSAMMALVLADALLLQMRMGSF
jgi:chorismate synthase